MPPLRVRACRDQADDGCPLPCALMSLAEPLAQDEAVGRVTPAHAFPALPERVRTRRKEALALCVIGQRSYVEREMEFRIERREQIRGRLPFIGAVPELDGLPACVCAAGRRPVSRRSSGRFSGAARLPNRNKKALRYAVSLPQKLG
jgi:hypothetical protein